MKESLLGPTEIIIPLILLLPKMPFKRELFISNFYLFIYFNIHFTFQLHFLAEWERALEKEMNVHWASSLWHLCIL